MCDIKKYYANIYKLKPGMLSYDFFFEKKINLSFTLIFFSTVTL